MKNKIKLVIKASFILFAFWIIFHKLNLTELKKIELKIRDLIKHIFALKIDDNLIPLKLSPIQQQIYDVLHN
jgi:hypothetical protein